MAPPKSVPVIGMQEAVAFPETVIAIDMKCRNYSRSAYANIIRILNQPTREEKEEKGRRARQEANRPLPQEFCTFFCLRLPQLALSHC